MSSTCLNALIRMSASHVTWKDTHVQPQGSNGRTASNGGGQQWCRAWSYTSILQMIQSDGQSKGLTPYGPQPHHSAGTVCAVSKLHSHQRQLLQALSSAHTDPCCEQVAQSSTATCAAGQRALPAATRAHYSDLRTDECWMEPRCEWLQRAVWLHRRRSE